MHSGSKLRFVLVATAVLIFAYGTTLVGKNPHFAAVCSMGLLLLLSGFVFSPPPRDEAVDPIVVGTGLVALIFVHMPVALLGLRIYPLSVSELELKAFLFAQAVAEESFFANYLLRSMGRSISAVLSTAIIFTVFHWAVYLSISSVVLLVVFLSRVVLNIVFLRGGFLSSSVCHALVNLFAG